MSATLFSADNDNFKIVRHSSNQIDLKFETGAWKLETKSENGIDYKTIKSTSVNNLLIDEEETLPIYSALVAIPDGMDVELVTDITRSVDLQSVNLLQKDAINRSKGNADVYPQKQIVISEPGQFRDFRVVNLNVYPFQYDTRTNNLKVTESADIKLRFVPSRGGTTNPNAGIYSSAFDNLYSSMIINYNNVRDEAVPTSQPKLLIIYPSAGDATFLAKLDDLVTWKKQKGYIVTIASTAAGEAGNTTTLIKAYIQSAYNSIATRPDVILLIGDPTTGLVVPANNAEYGDFPYTQLAGDDEYGDVQLGRISVETNEHFITYVNKVMWYERDIIVSSASWLDKMFLMGDSNSSGISTYYNNYYIRDISKAVNPNYSYFELYGSYGSSSSIKSTMNSYISQGVGFFNYRGYINMSGWHPYLSIPEWNLTNGFKLNHGVFVTCNTGTFYGMTSTTEYYTRWGSISSPAGGITAIGMATSSTHTAINSFLCTATFDGIFNQNMRSMGETVLFSRTYLQNIYGISNPTNARNFKRYYNLIGDPTVEVFVTVPQTFQLTCPTTIMSGTLNLEVTVKDDLNNPVSNSTVNFWQTGNLNLTAYTDANGKVIVDLPSTLSGNITVTVSKHDFKPAIQSISIGGTGLIYQSSVINDDNVGSSLGNNNQIINAGETIEYQVRIKNTGTSAVSTITGTLSCSDPYVQMDTGVINFPIAFAGSTVTSIVANVLTISPACPDNHPVTLYLNGSSSSGDWGVTIPSIINSPEIDYLIHTVTGANSYLEPGETTSIYCTVTNNGTESVSAVYGVLRSLNGFVEITDSLKYFGDITSGSTFSNSSNPFGIYAKYLTVTGMTIPMELYLYNASGYYDNETFTLTIGNPVVTDPLGQDSYGYFIYDVGDIVYPACPSYNWIGIAPAEDGFGTALTISDPGLSGDEGDQVGCDASETVNLPFTFKYYGVEYNQITVVSNGFLVFGTTADHDWRNGRLPGPAGPNAMIAPFWDDLSTMTGGIYTYYNTVNHYYIIEWYNLRNGYNRTSEETFQVILYDPAFYPTSTGDGPIKIQYKTFNNVDAVSSTSNHGNYCTVGIKDHTGTVGLEYTYNNSYPVAAQPLSNQKALYITTSQINPDEPFLALNQLNFIDTNSNGIAEPGETLDVRLTIINWSDVEALDVVATISESDPWINITSNTATYGNISGQGNVVNTSGLTVEVLPGCPNNYSAIINTTLNCSGYTFNRQFTKTVFTPVFDFGLITISDPVPGNANGRLDPGETVTLSIPINNIGGAPSSSGSVSLVCPTSGITVNDNTDIFPVLSFGGNSSLSFNITASPSMTIGTVIALDLSAIAGVYTLDDTLYLTVGLIIEDFETGTFNSYPWYFNGVLPWEIETTLPNAGVYSAKSGTITHSQSSTMETIRDVTSAGDVTFWYKVSSQSGYDKLNFYIDGVLQTSSWSGEVPWTQATYALTTGIHTLKWEYVKSLSTSTGSDCAWVDDIIFPPSNHVYFFYPPQNLTGIPANGYVTLNWQVPYAGTPNGYNIYRDTVLLTTTSQLTYIDDTVVNETEYDYYVTAIYSSPTGESAATNVISVTPSLYPLLTVGTGSTTNLGLPIEPFYGYTYSQSIYLQSEIDISNILINKIYWHYNGNSAWTDAIKIYMGHTDLTSFANNTSWIAQSNLTLVYDGNLITTTTPGWVEITLDTPFAYNNTQNLVIAVDENISGYHSSSDEFYCSVTTGNRSILFYSDTINPDPAAPPLTGTYLYTRPNIPNIQLKMGPLPDSPSFIMSPEILSFGDVYLGTNPTMSFTISNIGTGTLTGDITTPVGYTVNPSGRNKTETVTTRNDFDSRNFLSYSLGTGSNQAFNISFEPLAVQAYNGNVTITSNDSNHLNNLLSVSGVGIAPDFNPPTSLIPNTGNNFVLLSWTAPTGGSGTISGYKVFRNSVLITPIPITQTTYNDNGLINGTTYSYYVTALYTNPAGESEASNTVIAIPDNQVTLGTGTSITSSTYVSPINISYKSVHGQSVYTAAELNSAGVYGPIIITKIGFYIASQPALALPNYIIRMKHCTDSNAANCQTVDNMVTVYTNPSYMPTVGGFEMLTLSTPFVWNGTDNIVLDTAFGLVSTFSNTGTLQYTTVTNGFRAAREDNADQTHIFSGGYLYSRRANVKFTLSPYVLNAPELNVQKHTSGIRLHWPAITGANSYLVYGSQNPNNGFVQIAEVSSTEYIDISGNQNYFYKIVATDEISRDIGIK